MSDTTWAHATRIGAVRRGFAFVNRRHSTTLR